MCVRLSLGPPNCGSVRLPGPCLRLSPSFDFGSGRGGMVDFGSYLFVEYMPEFLVSLLSLAYLLLLVSLHLSYT